MELKRNNTKGFSIIEMTIASFLVLSVAAVSYNVLKSQTTKQIAEIQNQKSDSVSQTAISRFKADASMIDTNWVRYGVAPIWPHQGYGLGLNYYLLSNEDRKIEPVVNDGVTFLRRAPQSDRLNVPVGEATRICSAGETVSTDLSLYGSDLPLDSVQGLSVGDWLLVYQAGHYALGVIEDVQADNSASSNSSNNVASTTASDVDNTTRYTLGGGVGDSTVNASGGSVRIRRPNNSEMQQTAKTASGYSNGFVTQPGVVVANFDMFGTATSDTEDNAFCFETVKSNFQKVAPVSYYIDYRTSDGNSKTVTNSYSKDQNRGEQIKMLVRAEYVKGGVKREYLAPIDDLGFTYDLIDRNRSGDRIARDIGRTTGTGYLQNLSSNDRSRVTSDFLTSYQIVSMKMNVGYTIKDRTKPENDWQQNRQIKVALDPTLQKDAYNSDLIVVSSLTDNLNTIDYTKDYQSGLNEQIGKPLYLNNGMNNEVVVPVSTFQINTDGSMGSASKGALYVYDPAGCSVNAAHDCDPSGNNSAITFNLGSDKKFFPNTIAQITQPDGSRRIIVGGVAMTNKAPDGTNQVSRIPGIGIISLAANETLAQKLSKPSSGSCNILDCEWHPIASGPNTSELVDTAHIATDPDHTDEIYVATMTKQDGEASQSSVFKGIWNGSDYSYSKYANVVGTERGRIISAISDHPVKVGNETYLAVCLTKRMSSSCGGECLNDKEIPVEEKPPEKEPPEKEPKEPPSSGGRVLTTNLTPTDTLGEIQLVKQGSGMQNTRVFLAQHNYRCSSINVDTNGNLIVAGRLTVQPIPYAQVRQAVEFSENVTDAEKISEYKKSHFLYLDETVRVSGTKTIYADYYQVDPKTYVRSKNPPQFIGWLTGTSTVEFADGTFGMVNGNKYRVAGEFGDKVSGEYLGSKIGTPREYSNAGISKVELAGMNDRVVATIQTDPNNINNSIITATYAKRSTDLPSVYIPGSFWIDSEHVRSTPTPLPSVSPAMSETSWFKLYQALLAPRSETGLNSLMPTLGASFVQMDDCKTTHPKTCE